MKNYQKVLVFIVVASILAGIVMIVSFGIKTHKEFANGYPVRKVVIHKHLYGMNFFDSIQYYPEISKIRAMSDSALVIYLKKYTERIIEETKEETMWENQK